MAPNPVLEPPAFGWDNTWVATPAVIRSGQRFRMWYGGSASDVLGGVIAIGYTTSDDGINWQRGSNAPVLAPRPGAWDHTHIQRPAVLLDGDTLRMWYGGGASPGDHDIGYATSVDGIQWVRHPQPVLRRGPSNEWNAEFASPGTVIKEDGILKMWFYSGVGLVGAGNWGPASRIAIGYATSPDGMQWTLYDDPATTEPPHRLSDPVLVPETGKWDGNVVFSPSVIRVDAGYEMWYTGYDGNVRSGSIGISPDGIRWTNSDRNPVVGPLGGTSAVFPAVLRVGDEYRMWFADWTSSPDRAAIYLAVGRPRKPAGKATLALPIAVPTAGSAEHRGIRNRARPERHLDQEASHVWQYDHQRARPRIRGSDHRRMQRRRADRLRPRSTAGTQPRSSGLVAFAFADCPDAQRTTGAYRAVAQPREGGKRATRSISAAATRGASGAPAAWATT